MCSVCIFFKFASSDDEGDPRRASCFHSDYVTFFAKRFRLVMLKKIWISVMLRAKKNCDHIKMSLRKFGIGT